MEVYTVVFKQVDKEGFIRETVVTTESGYFSVQGQQVDYEGILWPKLHLVGSDLLPMHHSANLKYWWGKNPEEEGKEKWLSHVRYCLCPKVDASVTDEQLLIDRYSNFLNVADCPWYTENALGWAELATKALEFMTRAPKVPIWLTEKPNFDEESALWVELENYGKLPCSVSEGNGQITVETGDYTFECFVDKEAAGEVARAYYLDMAEHDPKEFACLVGEETLVNWGLNALAGPGRIKVRGLEEWLDLWLESPEEHFAHYDGEELEVISTSPEFKDQFGEITVAYRSN